MRAPGSQLEQCKAESDDRQEHEKFFEGFNWTKKSPGIAPRASSKVGVCLCVLDEGQTYEVDSSRLAALDGGHLRAEPDGGGRCDVLAVTYPVALYWA